MANRAYLYCSDNGDPQDAANWGWEQREECPYYDSRWTIPFAWFFFFQPSDIKLVDENRGDSHWQEAKFLADKQQAFAAFARRKPLLLKLLGSTYPAEAMIDHFLQIMAAWPEKYLLCDPSEVFGGYSDSDEVNFAHLLHITQILDTPDMNTEESIDAFRYSSFQYKDEMDFRVCVIGFTYEVVPGYFMPAIIETESANGDGG